MAVKKTLIYRARRGLFASLMTFLKYTFFILFLFGAGQANAVTNPHKDVRGLYKDADTLFWVGDKQLERNKKKISDILNDANEHGLDSADYSAIEFDKILSVKINDEDARQFDYALTYALWRYASDLAGQKISDTDFMEMAFSRNLKENIESLSPQSTLYNVLKARLSDVDTILSKDDLPIEYQTLSFGKRVFKVGDAHADVPILRARMVDYGAGESFGDDPYNYDIILVDALKKFQAEKGLKSDGIIGPSTLKYLNHSLDDERKQIVLNMARLRAPQWRNRPDLRIDVDISRYWLTAHEGGNVEFEMPVVVGSKKRKTVSFTTTMTGVRLNPGWTLPSTIKTEDYIPKLRTNPEWVTQRGVQIYTSWDRDAEPIDPTTVDWSLLTDNEIKAMRMYKSAGAGNPLGKYRFLMSNRYDIYLHDTNRKSLFKRSMRAKSSGCVRLSDPRKVMEFLFKGHKKWTPERLGEYLDRGKTYDLGANCYITKPIGFAHLQKVV
ncbi:MAG: hypothetical protein COB76_03860, partial [Alphaproteobacteria bacterium]